MMQGPVLAILFAVAVIVAVGILSGDDHDCPRGSVTASGIARCR